MHLGFSAFHDLFLPLKMTACIWSSSRTIIINKSLYISREQWLCPSFPLRACRSNCSTEDGRRQWILEMTVSCWNTVSGLVEEGWCRLCNAGQVQTQLCMNTPTWRISLYKITGLHWTQTVSLCWSSALNSFSLVTTLYFTVSEKQTTLTNQRTQFLKKLWCERWMPKSWH